MKIHRNKIMYTRLRDLLLVTNRRMAQTMGVTEETARAYGNPHNVRKPSADRLRQAIIGNCKHVPDLQQMLGLKPTTSMFDLEILADKVIKKMTDEAEWLAGLDDYKFGGQDD